MNETTKLEIIHGKSKKSGKDWTALKIKIGDWEKLIFGTKFELDYIEKVLTEEEE